MSLLYLTPTTCTAHKLSTGAILKSPGKYTEAPLLPGFTASLLPSPPPPLLLLLLLVLLLASSRCCSSGGSCTPNLGASFLSMSSVMA